MSNEGHLTGGRSTSSSVLDSQESSWIGLLSRPALALLQKIRNRTMKTSFVNEESDFLSQLDDVQLGPPHLSYLQCELDGAAGLQEPRGAGTLPWLSTDSLREIGLQSGTEVDLSLCQQTQFGYFSSVRTVLGHVLLSSQEVRAVRGQSWSPSTSRTWWGSFWEGKESSQMGQLSDVRWAEEGVLAGQLCPQQTPRGMLGENAGPADHKEDLPNNGGLHTVQKAEEATPDRRLSIRDQLSCSGATATGEASPATPEQDNGYSSLEEEHLSTLTSPREGLPLQEAETSERVEMEGDPSEGEEEVLTVPQCRNKTINFIMGGPCSEDESSQSEESSSDDDDDDDGFDSEGSSELSDDTNEDEDDDSDSEADSEAERLWSSLCQNEDPYNPRNFTARLHNIPASTSPSSAHSTPSSSPPSGSDIWDDSASVSEVDEESLRLWDSFSSSSDPFNPLNFQAPIRTHKPPKVRARKTSPCHNPVSPPEYRKEEAEERLDSGFCEAPTARSCGSIKKVRFCDDVKEFFASCGEEDRRGPWEELARDRCRFLRRCQEVEQSIAYCLQPQHRRRVYERLAAL